MQKFLLYIILLMVPAITMGQKNIAEKKTNSMVINLPTETINFETMRYGSDFDAKKERTYLWFKSGKVMETEGGYEGKLLNGKYTVFYPSKALKEKGQVKKGLRHGEWRSWHPSGTLKEIIHWKKGQKHGMFLSYDEAGDLMVQSRYKKGKLHGKSIIGVKGNSNVRMYKNGIEVVQEKKETPTKHKKPAKVKKGKEKKAKEKKPKDTDKSKKEDSKSKKDTKKK